MFLSTTIKNVARDIDNVRHSDFQKSMYECITSGIAPIEKLNLSTPLLQAWKKQIDIQVDICKRTPLQVETERAARAADNRDWYLRRSFELIRTARTSPDNEVRQAGEELRPIRNAYKDILKASMRQATTLVEGMLLDIRKPKYEQGVAVLGLEAFLAKIQEANTTVVSLLADRAVDVTDNALPTATEVRKETDRYWKMVVERIFASRVLCNSAEDMAAIDRLIMLLNRHIDEIMTSYNKHMGKTKSAKKPQTDNPSPLPVPTDTPAGDGGEDNGGTATDPAPGTETPPTQEGGSDTEGGSTDHGTDPAPGGTDTPDSGQDTGGDTPGTGGNQGDWQGFEG